MKAKSLSFPFIYFSESSLFNGLRVEKIEKSASPSPHASVCPRKPVPPSSSFQAPRDAFDPSNVKTVARQPDSRKKIHPFGRAFPRQRWPRDGAGGPTANGSARTSSRSRPVLAQAVTWQRRLAHSPSRTSPADTHRKGAKVCVQRLSRFNGPSSGRAAARPKGRASFRTPYGGATFARREKERRYVGAFKT